MAKVYLSKSATTIPTLSTGDTLVIAEGGQLITGGLNQNAVDLVDLLIQKGFIGSFAGALRFGITGKVEYNPSAGRLPFHASGTVPLLRTKGHGQLYLTGGGTFTRVEIGSGLLNVDDNVVITTLLSRGATGRILSGTAFTTLDIGGGDWTLERGWTGNAFVSGGARLLVTREDTGASMPAGGDLLVISDAHVQWRGGDVTVRLLPGGTIDLSEAPNDLDLTIEGAEPELKASRLASQYAVVTAEISAVVSETQAEHPSEI